MNTPNQPHTKPDSHARSDLHKELQHEHQAQPQPTPIDVCIISAMPEEMAPMRELLTRRFGSECTCTPLPYPAHASASVELLQCADTAVLLAVTGIGFSATASYLGWMMAHYAPESLISIGSAGGLSADSHVGEVVAGSIYRNSGADGTAFGYVRGQVPGQPEFFEAHTALLTAATVEALENDQIDIRTAQMLSSDSFITHANAADMREAFPHAVSTDMESYAAAHVAYQWGVPFLSIRAISDLCAPDEHAAASDQAEQFHAELSQVAVLSAHVALSTLTRAGILG